METALQKLTVLRPEPSESLGYEGLEQGKSHPEALRQDGAGLPWGTRYPLACPPAGDGEKSVHP